MAEFGVDEKKPIPGAPTYKEPTTIWDAIIGGARREDGFTPRGAVFLQEQVEAIFQGNADLSAPEEKGAKKGLEKLIRGGPLGEAIVDVLFGDNKAGAPDPSPPSGGTGRVPGDIGFVVNDAGELVAVQMLPVWTRDP